MSTEGASVGRIGLDLGVNYSNFGRELSAIAPRTQSMFGGMFAAFGKIAAAAFGARLLYGFAKDAIQLASDLQEVQNVVDVTFGNMTEQVNKFAKSAITDFGLSELSAKKYASTMGAMLKSSGLTGQAVADMSIEMSKLTADMASFYNLSGDEAFSKIRAGISGETEPLKQLGINLNVANLEAFALTQGIKKSYQQMSQAEQVMLRYNYLLKVSADAQGDFARNSDSWANQTKVLSEQWKIFKGIMGAGFINTLTPIIKGINFIIRKLQIAAEYYKAFTELVFGNAMATGESAGSATEAAKATDSLGDSVTGAGKAVKKANKEMRKNLAGFDEINVLAKNAASSLDGLSDETSNIGGIDLGTATTGEFEVDLKTEKVEKAIARLSGAFKEFYNNWGGVDIVRGFREGLELIDFNTITSNISTVFDNLRNVVPTLQSSLAPVFQSLGTFIGTNVKYGIAITGNLFEPITLGWANFTTNIKQLINAWLIETSQDISSGFNNLSSMFEDLGSSWVKSMQKYKPKVAKEVEDTLANVTKTFMLLGDITSDTFLSVTDNLKKFTADNSSEIQRFTDGIVDAYTKMWDLVNTIWSDALTGIKDFWDEWGEGITTTVMDMVTTVSGSFLYLWNDLVVPVWNRALEWLERIWSDSAKGIVDQVFSFVGKVTELITLLWDGVFKPFGTWFIQTLAPIISNALKVTIDSFGIFFQMVGNIIEGLLIALNGLLDFILGAFTGEWRRAWDGIKGIFKGVAESFEGVFKAAINSLIKIVNSFIRFWNKIQLKVPAVDIPFMGKVGGFAIGVPKISEIPFLAKGGIIDQPTLAMVGERGKEAVMPLENNTGWIADLATKIAEMLSLGQASGEQPIDLQLVIQLGEELILDKLIQGVNTRMMISGKNIIKT